MLSTFPIFKKLELRDREFIEKFTKQFPPYNDFEFTSLWTYNIKGKNVFSILNDNLVIKIQDFITDDFFYSFIGTNNIKDTITKLLRRSKEDNAGTSLRLIPEINFSLSPDVNKYFSIREDPDSFDYILSVDELAELKGGKYSDKRNLVNRFKKLYPQHSIKQLNLRKEKTRQDIRDLFSVWEQKKEKGKNKTKIERAAIEKLFELVDLFNIIGVGIYIENKLIGFSTYHTVQENFAIMSFEKGDISYEGIYSYLNHEAAKHLKTLGSVYLNYEQDLGIPGLKKAKSLWRPIFFLKKYVISNKINI